MDTKPRFCLFRRSKPQEIDVEMVIVMFGLFVVAPICAALVAIFGK